MPGPAAVNIASGQLREDLMNKTLLRFELLAAVVLLTGAAGCTANLPPSTKTLQREAAGRTTTAALVSRYSKALAAAGYEIKSKDEPGGLIQAFRPSRGVFGDPNYGHRVTVAVDETSVNVTAFASEGTVGAESPDEISAEVLHILQGAR
jgi:hypothetical protein